MTPSRPLTIGILALLGTVGCIEYDPRDISHLPDSPSDPDVGVRPTPPFAGCFGPTNTVVREVTFPERSGCDWESGGNLSPRDAHFRGHEVQSFAYDIPVDTTVCDVRFEFSEEHVGISFPFRYDDHMLLTFNDRVVFSTYRPMVELLNIDDQNYFLFDWPTVAGIEMGFEVIPWAIGTTYTVDLPNSDIAGDATLSIDPEAISDLTDSALAQNKLDLQLYAFGDNDDSDCGHTGLSFWVEIELAVD